LQHALVEQRIRRRLGSIGVPVCPHAGIGMRADSLDRFDFPHGAAWRASSQS
jgi:hypothetical protein